MRLSPTSSGNDNNNEPVAPITESAIASNGPQPQSVATNGVVGDYNNIIGAETVITKPSGSITINNNTNNSHTAPAPNQILETQRLAEQQALHRAYLQTIIDDPNISLVNLAQINPTQGQSGIALEEIYVDLPISLWVSMEVKDWQVMDWWLTTTQSSNPSEGDNRWQEQQLGEAAEELELEYLHGQGGHGFLRNKSEFAGLGGLAQKQGLILKQPMIKVATKVEY
jgi:hypothetical protein